MSKSNAPGGGPSSVPNVLPVIISAVVIFVVLGLIFGLLVSRPSPQQTAQFEAETAQALQATDAAAQNAIPTSATGAAPTEDASAAANPNASKEDMYSAAPPITIDATKNYTATITTPRGDIVVKLRPDLAPETVNSFVFLSREGYYNGLTWHRVIEGFMAQGGDPTGTGMGGPGYTVKGEFTDKVLFDRPGIVAMARPGNDVDGNGSQFFITTAPYPSLNGQYTVFGEVVEGQDVVDAIPVRDPDSATAPGEEIVNIAIDEG